MQNATYLTDEKYPGKEADLWTPCIHEFFDRCRPVDLPVSACIRFPSEKGPWYESRQQSPILRVDGEVLKEPGPNKFLPKIGAMFGMNLMDDPGRCPPRGDIAGIVPDIVLIHPNRQGICIIENKPFYRSSFDGNQAPPDGAYIDFVLWLNRKEVPTEYMVIHSSSWSEYPKVKQLQDILQGHFGSLLLEDIFLHMAAHKFTYPPVAERWEDFTDKSLDFA